MGLYYIGVSQNYYSNGGFTSFFGNCSSWCCSCFQVGKGNQKRGGDGGKRLKEIEGDPFLVDIGQIVKIFCLI